ncbi:MAG: hypothetical protein FDW93_01050 [Bergeyella sp.]|nr:hypothetical protein [Bergeyella sp.]
MRNSFFLLSLTFLSVFLVGCTKRVVEEKNGAVYSKAYDVRVNFKKDPSDNVWYYQERIINTAYSDVVLVYAAQAFDNNNNPIWETLPRTYYTRDGKSAFYDYKFIQTKLEITLTSKEDLNNLPFFTKNRIFRVVLVPASRGESANLSPENLRKLPYEEVIKRLGMEKSSIKTPK